MYFEYVCQNEVNELHSFHSTTGPECHKLSIGILYFIMEVIQADLGFHFCFHDNISKCLIIKADTHTHIVAIFDVKLCWLVAMLILMKAVKIRDKTAN